MMVDVATTAAKKNAHVWERDEFDWYVEPVRATEQLLDVEEFHGPVWDPACGGGNTLRALTSRGIRCTGSDIVDRGVGGVCDFLDPVYTFVDVPEIICNPPFYRAKGAEAFIRRALEVALVKVAMFVDVKFLAGSSRAQGLFADHPPSRVWIITPRPSCPPGELLKAGGKAEGGTADWCWLVWDIGRPAPGTRLGWLTAKGSA